MIVEVNTRSHGNCHIELCKYDMRRMCVILRYRRPMVGEGKRYLSPPPIIFEMQSLHLTAMSNVCIYKTYRTTVSLYEVCMCVCVTNTC